MQLGKIAGLELCDQPLRNIFGDALLELAKTNPKVVVLDGDLGNSTKAEYVRQEFPDRFFNIGIAESNLVGIGAALTAACMVAGSEGTIIVNVGNPPIKARSSIPIWVGPSLPSVIPP